MLTPSQFISMEFVIHSQISKLNCDNITSSGKKYDRKQDSNVASARYTLQERSKTNIVLTLFTYFSLIFHISSTSAYISPTNDIFPIACETSSFTLINSSTIFFFRFFFSFYLFSYYYFKFSSAHVTTPAVELLMAYGILSSCDNFSSETFSSFLQFG